jgi:hypothetical protein
MYIRKSKTIIPQYYKDKSKTRKQKIDWESDLVDIYEQYSC